MVVLAKFGPPGAGGDLSEYHKVRWTASCFFSRKIHRWAVNGLTPWTQPLSQVVLAASLIQEGFCFKEGKQNQRDRNWINRPSVC